MTRKRKSPGALAGAGEASDYFHTETIGESPRYCKPVPLGGIVANPAGRVECDLPGKVAGAVICEQPLELGWKDIRRLGDCWLSLWLADCPRILVEDQALAEWIYDKLRAEGVLERLPEIRMGSVADAA